MNQKRITKHLFLFVVFFIGVLPIKGQNIPQIETLTTEQGLSFRDVRSIAQDKHGFMWFGTHQGLNRYDGYNFKIYNSDKNNPNYIENEKISAQIKIIKDKNELWFVASEHVYKLNLLTDKVDSYTKNNGVKGDVLFIHKDDKDQIWIITDDFWNAPEGKAKQYLQKYDTKNGFTVFSETTRGTREFSHVTTDNNQNVYWGTILKGVLKYNKDGKLISEQKLGSFNWYGQTMYFGQSFFDEANNHYYFRKRKNGILKYNDSTQAYEEYYNFQETIYHALQDNQGNLWFAGHESLYRIDKKGNLQDFTKELKKHIAFTRINAIFQDANNLLWIATDNGLFKIRIKKQLFNQLYKSNTDGWGNTFRGFFETKKGTIIAMCENQYKLVGFDSLENIFDVPLHHAIKNTPTPMAASRFFAFNKDKTAVYSVNDNLIQIHIDDGLITLFPKFKPRLNITSGNPLLGLKNGNLLFGFSLSKLTVFNPETKQDFLVFPNVKTEDNISELRYFLQSKEENIVWVGTQNNGILKINLNGTIEAHYTVSTNPSLSKNTILVLFEDNNKLWIGTFGGGLNCLSITENKITSFTKKQGLSDNNVVGILPYENDYLWISTYNGLSLFNKKTKEFQNFYTEDGLTNNEFNYSSFFKDSKGNFYFGSMNGITKFNPKPILKKNKLPPLQFTHYTNFSSKTNQTYNHEWTLENISKIDISPYDQYFTVNWTMPNYFQNSKNKYYTKLDGFEDRWFFQGNRASIRYNKLPAGDYILRVRGSDSNGNFSASELELPITVRQIFYKTWWFICLLFLSVLGILYAIFNYRLMQLKALNDLRTKISSDLHDDVGSLLSGLAMQTEMLENKAKKEDKARLNRISNLSREAITKMRDLVWSIDNRRDRIHDLIERMKELADEMLLPKAINYNINNKNLNINKKLSILVKQQLFFIYKEAITNIVRHSNATEVSISFKNKNGLGYLKIADNGTISQKDSKTGLGIENMKMRAKKIQAEINFYNEKGFTVIIKLPFSL